LLSNVLSTSIQKVRVGMIESILVLYLMPGCLE
jgi:hypothetical protein